MKFKLKLCYFLDGVTFIMKLLSIYENIRSTKFGRYKILICCHLLKLSTILLI